jgi:hypothetical protein
MNRDLKYENLQQMMLTSDVGIKMLKNQVVRISRKHESLRDEFDYQRIIDFFIYYNIFKNIYQFNDLYMLAKKAKTVVCASGQILFRQGDEADGFYVIVKGKIVGGYQKKDCLVGKYLEEIDVLFDLKSGIGFGEISILENSKRSVTMRAQKETHLLFIERSVYLDIVCPFLLKTIRNNMDILRPLNLFKNFNNERLKEFCSISFEKQYSFDFCISGAGKPPSKIFFIKSGLIDGFRHLNLSDLSQPTQKKYGSLIKSLKFPLKIKMATLGKLTRQFGGD